MPANLTPQYLEAEANFRAAKTKEEKLKALDEMLAFIPKHKGTDKLQADIKRRIKKLKQAQQKKSATARTSLFYVPKEGCAQVVLLGFPNSGKSQVLTQVTKAQGKVADYPFTTVNPLPGMMKFENIQIQLVDLPPIAPDYMESWFSNVARSADAALLIIDLSSDNILEQIEIIIKKLEDVKIKLIRNKSLEEPPLGWVDLPTIIAGNKVDLEGTEDRFSVLEELYKDKFDLIKISAKIGLNLDKMKSKVFEILNIIRVYSKPPGKKEDKSTPFVLKKGSNLLQAAEHIHKEFASKLKYARLWGSGKYPGQMIQRDYVLRDGDIIELHM